MQTSLQLLLASTIGVISHLGFFIHGERDQQAPLFCKAFFVLFTLLLYGEYEGGLLNTLLKSTLVLLTYTSAVWSSMIMYRLHFHRLASFPGPVMARTSKFWQIFQNSKTPNYLRIDALCSKYGDLVRTGKSIGARFLLRILFRSFFSSFNENRSKHNRSERAGRLQPRCPEYASWTKLEV